jgi:hypothetical protein
VGQFRRVARIRDKGRLLIIFGVRAPDALDRLTLTGLLCPRGLNNSIAQAAFLF